MKQLRHDLGVYIIMFSIMLLVLFLSAFSLWYFGMEHLESPRAWLLKGYWVWLPACLGVSLGLFLIKPAK